MADSAPHCQQPGSTPTICSYRCQSYGHFVFSHRLLLANACLHACRHRLMCGLTLHADHVNLTCSGTHGLACNAVLFWTCVSSFRARRDLVLQRRCLIRMNRTHWVSISGPHGAFWGLTCLRSAVLHDRSQHFGGMLGLLEPCRVEFGLHVIWTGRLDLFHAVGHKPLGSENPEILTI